jgi:hypothetical protein
MNNKKVWRDPKHLARKTQVHNKKPKPTRQQLKSETKRMIP